MLNILAVRDSAAAAFMQPFFAPTEAMGVRMFKEAVKDKESPFSKNPADFELYWLGMFDDGIGAFVSDKPRLLYRATDIRDGAVVQFPLKREDSNAS